MSGRKRRVHVCLCSVAVQEDAAGDCLDASSGPRPRWVLVLGGQRTKAIFVDVGGAKNEDVSVGLSMLASLVSMLLVAVLITFHIPAARVVTATARWSSAVTLKAWLGGGATFGTEDCYHGFIFLRFPFLQTSSSMEGRKRRSRPCCFHYCVFPCLWACWFCIRVYPRARALL